MSLRTVIGGIGAAVGGFFGGPTGAQLGWALGSVVGNVVDPQTIQGPRLGDIAQQTSQEGGPIPIVFGMSPPITGNVIATSGPRIQRTRSGGKGTPRTVSESAFRTYAVGVCEGPIGGFMRVWRNNILVYDASEDPLVTEEDNELFLETARFFLGTYDQEASPDLEAIYGVGTTAAHRGIAYMVMADEDVTDMGGAIPQWQFQVANSSELSAEYSNEVLHPWLSGADPTNPLNTNSFSVASAGWNSNDNKRSPNPSPSISNPYSTLSAALSACQAWAGFSPLPAIGYSADSNIGHLVQASDIPGTDVSYERFHPATVHVTFPYHGVDTTLSNAGAAASSVAGVTYVRNNDAAISPVYMDTYFTTGSGGGGGAVWYGEQSDSSHWYSLPFQFGVSTGFGTTIAASTCATISVTRTPGPPAEGWTPVAGTFHVLQTYSSGPTPNRKPLNPCLIPSDDNYNNQAFWEAAYAAAVDDGDMAAGLDYGDDYPVEVSDAYEIGTPVVSGGVSLPDLVSAICARSGIEDIDVADLPTDVVIGLTITNQYAAAQAIQSLAEIYQFDPSCYDSQIHFIPRGGNSVATITEDDMVDDDAEVEQSKRGNAIAIPRLLNLNYYDADTGGLTSAKQVSERPVTGRNTANASIQSPVVMSSETAAQAADILHKVMEEENKGELRFNLPDSFLELVPSNPIIVQWNQRSERARIVQCEIMDGFQSYIALRDRQSAFTSEVEGIPPPLPTAPVSRVVGPTLLVPLDIPLLRDADDNLGMAIYIAIAGSRESWGGAQVELSYDGGSNYVRSSDGAVSAIIGELVSALDDHPAEYPDETHECVVRLDTYGAELEETTLAGMLNRTNLAAIGSPETGWELVNFSNATQDSAGEWTLSEFLRGRKATEPREHPIGSKFVLLNRSVIAIEPMSVADIGRTMTFRATSFGTGTDTGTVVSMVYQGWTQKERSAAYLDASIDGDTLTAEWMGVGRLGGGVSAQHGVRFTGYEVTLRSDEGVQTSMTTSQSVDLDVTSLTGALYVGVSQVNSLTGPGTTIWWPNNPGDLTEVIFALGLSHPFVSARFIEREYFTDSDDPYMVDTVNYEGATGNFVLRKYPVDASSDTDAIGTSFAGDVFFGAARDSATEDVLFIVSSIEPYQIGILRRLDVSEMILGDTLTNLTTHSRGSNYVDAWLNLGELYGLKSSTIDVLDPDNLTEIRVLTLSVLAHRAILGTSDLWVAHRGGGTLEGQVHNLDKTDGSVIQTIETRRFPMGGAIYSGNLYVYCLNNSSPDPSPTGIGVFKYRLSDGVELDSWINADDSASYGATDVVVWLAGTRLGVGWAGHKVFDMATEAFV